ncbi:MAG: hypothetical protein M0R73_04285 [Dehalococcoidia bacterium]|nr:hypothetical protein [Dehalococcoidia bacterium]
MNPIRATLSALALGVLSLGLVACDGASADGNTDDRTETPTAAAPVTGPDTPVDSDDATAQPGDSATPAWDHPRMEELAPIERIDVIVRESFPPQYVLEITSGLPSGCAAFERTDVTREGNTFKVSVVNTVPAPDADVACTMIYGYYDQSVLLEDIESGVEYTVDVNDKTLTFTGQ